MFENINEFAVITSAIFAVAFGNVWYSTTMFGKVWVKMTKGNVVSIEENNKTLLLDVVKSLVVYIVIFFALAKFSVLSRELESQSFNYALFLFYILLLGHLLSLIIWEKKPLNYFFIHGGYVILTLLGGLAIIMYWPW